MPKKNWTDEERAAFGEKMRQARLKKETHDQEILDTLERGEEEPIEAPEPTPPQEPNKEPQITLSQEDYSSLLLRMQELESAQWRSFSDNQAPGSISTGGGKLTGTYEKYSTDKTLYPSPVNRLKIEPKLARFAFEINYELEFEVSESAYETIDGIRTKEPKFTLDLVRVIMDEETGEPTPGRYVVCRLVMHEDPDAALVIARDNNITVETDDESLFLNEMRYLRMRDWLLECFYPAPIKAAKNKKEVVIGGQLVEYFEVNSETSASIPFNQMDSTKKLR